MKTHKIIVDLPDEYAAGIGRIIAHWSYVEWLLRDIAYKLLRIDPKKGRVAVREPRAEESLKMIQELMELSALPTTQELFSTVSKALAGAKSARDLIAHGSWMVDEETNQIFVQRTYGSWRPDPNGPKISRKIKPEGVPISPAELEETRLYVAEIIVAIKKLRTQVSQALASLDKPPAPESPGPTQNDPNQATP